MTTIELIRALRRIKVQTGSLACLGCGYEHDCGIHGCRIIREAAKQLERHMSALQKRGAPEPPSVLLAAPSTHGGVPAAYTSDMGDRVTEWRFFGSGQVFLPGGTVAFASYWVPSWSEVDDAINP